MIGIALIENKLRENRLEWFELICHWPIDAIVRQINMIIDNNNTRGRSSPNLTLDAVIKKDILGLNLSQHLAHNKAQWLKMIHIVDPN